MGGVQASEGHAENVRWWISQGRLKVFSAMGRHVTKNRKKELEGKHDSVRSCLLRPVKFATFRPRNWLTLPHLSPVIRTMIILARRLCVQHSVVHFLTVPAGRVHPSKL